jgi:ribose transport system permease protein
MTNGEYTERAAPTTSSVQPPPVSAEPSPAVAPGGRRQIPELGALFVLLIALSAFFAIKSPVFLNWDNWLNILTAVAVTGIIAAPATLLLISGQFDLSVGSGAAFCGVVLATAAPQHGLAGAVILTILAGLALGVLNGFFVTVVGVSSLITTLGTLAAFRGLAQILSNGQTTSLNGFSGLGTARPLLNIPVPVLVFIGVIMLFWFIMRYTVYGRTMYAIGSNELAARLSGLGLKRAVFGGFVLSGLCVALAGLILTSQLSAASPLAASGLELSVVTAVVLGGASLSGGRGSVLGTALGLMIIGVLNNGLVLMNVGSFWQDVARGSLLILAVSADQLRLRLTRD